MSVDVSGLVLHRILANPEEGLEAWAKLKLAFFSTEYASIYSAIAKYYSKQSRLPSFEDLDVTVRDVLLKNNLKALSKLDDFSEVSLDLLTDAIIDEYTQDEVLKKLDGFVDNITLLDTEEIKQEVANILLHLEEKTHTSEKVCLMSDITILEDSELDAIQVPLGFNNSFDAEVRAATSELVMIGGKRGSGKSVVATNIFNSQYEQGNVGLLFSIEMNKREVFNRSLSALADVEHSRLRNGNFRPEDLRKIAKVRADMFVDSEEFYQKYIETGDFRHFEYSLVKNCKLKEDNQLIIIDNQRLTLADIDMNIQKFKAQFGEKLRTVVVDYVNQIEIDDIYDWKKQITLSKQLKNFARKYDVVMVTPYQIDNEGEARFAKGLLDAADIAMILHANDDHLRFESTKTRSTSPFKTNSGINWKTLKIHPEEYIIPKPESEEKEQVTLIKKKDTSAEDLPF